MASTTAAGPALADPILQHNTAALLLLYDTLMGHSSLPPTQQAAWRIATQHLAASTTVDPVQLSTAVHLISAIGQCCPLNEMLQGRLIQLLEDSSVLGVLLTALKYALEAEDHQTTAAVVKIVSNLVQLLLPEPTAAAKDAVAAALDDRQHRACLWEAAYSSSEAATVVATLLVAVASCGLPAGDLMQKLTMHHSTRSNIAREVSYTFVNGGGITCTVGISPGLLEPYAVCEFGPAQHISGAWLKNVLQPLLLQIQQALEQERQRQQQQMSLQQQQTQQQQQQLPMPASQYTHGWPSSSSFQQLWHLLCVSIKAADGVILGDALLGALEAFFKSAPVSQAVQTVLLAGSCTANTQAQQAVQQPRSSTSKLVRTCSTSPQAVAPYTAVAGVADAVHAGASSSSSSSPSSSSTSTHSSSELRAFTVEMLQVVAGHSSSLAKQCFDILAPNLPQVLALENSDSYHTPAAPICGWDVIRITAARLERAIVVLWQKLLAKGKSSFPGALHCLLQQWLPTAAQALAAAAPRAAPAEAPAAAAAEAPAAALAAAAIAAAAPLAAPAGEVCDSELLRVASAIATAFVPLAEELQANRGPLLSSKGPTGMTNLLTPLVPALVRLVEAAAEQAQGRDHADAAGPEAAASAADPAAAATAAAAAAQALCSMSLGTGGSPGDEVGGYVLLLALWLLQSWVAAQQQQQQQPSSLQAAAATASAEAASAAAGGTPAASILPGAAASILPGAAASILPGAAASILPGAAASILPGAAASILPTGPLRQQMLQAVAALLAADGSSSYTLQLRCQAKALDLARVLLACQPGSSCTACAADVYSTTGSTSADPLPPGQQPSAAEAAAGSPGAAEEAASDLQLLAAVSKLFARSPQDPMNPTHRELLQSACELTAELARRVTPLKTLVTTALAAATAAFRQAVTAEPAVAVAAADAAPRLAVDAAPHPHAAAPLTAAQQQQQQQQRLLFHAVYNYLQALQQDLSTRKLARSSSRVDLLSAVEETLDVLRDLGLGGVFSGAAAAGV